MQEILQRQLQQRPKLGTTKKSILLNQVLLGCGSIAQVVTGKPNEFFSDFQSICFGWGFALMIGILVSGGVSGGHLNPAVTLAMACILECSWVQVGSQ